MILARSVNVKGMAHAHRSPNLLINVDASPETIRVDIGDGRSESLSLFEPLGEEQRLQLASDAWSIGLRALANAYSQAQESRLQDIGKSLLEDVDHQLKSHIEVQKATIAQVLTQFFDPRDGQVTQRLEAFVDDQGVLARLLERYLGPRNSVLVETLAQQVGNTSPLFKKLSSTDSDGLVKVLEAQLRVVMHEGRSEMIHALDPLAEDGAVARFLKSLREELKASDHGLDERLSKALMALDANDESSLINRLVRETNGARQAVLQAVNPDAPNSPMAIMRQSLTTLLQDHAKQQQEFAKEQFDRQSQFEREVQAAITRLETRRDHDMVSPRGGLDFEDAVVEFVTAALRGAPCMVEPTGMTTGLRARCKKGDVVIRFTEESVFCGAGIVVEAKRDASYSVSKAIAELEEARKNRGACAGVFVMAKSHAPEGFPGFGRFGNNVLLVWDEGDTSTDPYLHAGLLLGLGLVSRTRAGAETGDINALRDLEARIEDEIRRFEKMEKLNDAIQKNSDGIGEELRKAKRQLNILLQKGKDVMTALQVSVVNEEEEKATPILIPKASLAEASSALAVGHDTPALPSPLLSDIGERF